MKKIAILGLTGSIGLSAVEVIRQHKKDFRIVFASSHNNIHELLKLASEFEIPQLVITNEEIKNEITDLPNQYKIGFGNETLQECLQEIDCDIVLNAIAGSAGLKSSITVLERGIDLALANKESLIMAGHLIKPILARTGAKLIPVDSEHSAIFQAIGCTPTSQIRKLIITASGGPFRQLPLTDFKKITLAQTLNHPTWNMGAKITIDSATMMNKGLEVIEAHWLFNIGFDKIQAVIHPQSIIHSMVEFVDGSILSQMSLPSMQLPILYALAYPDRMESDILPTDVLDLPNLSFEKLQKDRFPLFFLACEVGKTAGLLPTIMNAANEAAIELFLNKKIAFNDIFRIVQNSIERASNVLNPGLEVILENNRETYLKTSRDYKNLI
jgi:1-deoxy-D-xylulose-5-phosphate reductoisomerase